MDGWLTNWRHRKSCMSVSWGINADVMVCAIDAVAVLRNAPLAASLLEYMQTALRTDFAEWLLPVCRSLLGHDLICLMSRLNAPPMHSAKQTILAMSMLVLTAPCWHRLPLGTVLLSWGQPQSLCMTAGLSWGRPKSLSNSLSQSYLLGRRRPHRLSSWQHQQMQQQPEGLCQAGRAVKATLKRSILQLLRLRRQVQEWCRTAQQLGPPLTASLLLASCSSLCWLCGPSRSLRAGGHD